MQREIETDRQTETERDRDRERQTDRDREKQRYLKTLLHKDFFWGCLGVKYRKTDIRFLAFILPMRSVKFAFPIHLPYMPVSFARS